MLSGEAATNKADWERKITTTAWHSSVLSWFCVSDGLRQSSVLSPYLFFFFFFCVMVQLHIAEDSGPLRVNVPVEVSA